MIKSGDKVELLEPAYEGMPGKEAAKLAKLPYLTVESVMNIPISDSDGTNRRLVAEIYCNETEYLIGLEGTHFKKY